MADTKKISTQITNSLIDENGEMVSTEMITTKFIEREPDYVKLYITDILKLSNISKSNNDILLAILKRMNYNNEVFLLSYVKEEIAEELGLKAVTISKALGVLTQKSILIRKARGCYLINPFFFGRGKWEDIKKIRLELSYDSKGKHIYKVEIERDELINSFENE
jgi:DNA-binding MarR family transcriptional regulator